MGIDVKLYCQVIALLNIELLDTVFTEHAKHAFTGILTRNFNYIFLRHP